MKTWKKKKTKRKGKFSLFPIVEMVNSENNEIILC